MASNKASEELRKHEPQTPASPPKLLDTADEVSAEKRSGSNSTVESPLPRWLISLIGHVLAALLGLILGYLILARLRPQIFPLPWWP